MRKLTKIYIVELPRLPMTSRRDEKRVAGRQAAKRRSHRYLRSRIFTPAGVTVANYLSTFTRTAQLHDDHPLGQILI